MATITKHWLDEQGACGGARRLLLEATGRDRASSYRLTLGLVRSMDRAGEYTESTNDYIAWFLEHMPIRRKRAVWARYREILHAALCALEPDHAEALADAWVNGTTHTTAARDLYMRGLIALHVNSLAWQWLGLRDAGTMENLDSMFYYLLGAFPRDYILEETLSAYLGRELTEEER